MKNNAKIGVLAIVSVLIISIISIALADISLISQAGEEIKIKTEDIKNKTKIEELRNNYSIEYKLDSTKEYDPLIKKLTITNTTENKKLLELKLLSNYENNKVSSGKDKKVLEFETEDFNDLEQLFDSVYFYDLNNNYTEMQKNFTLKYLITYQEIVCYNESINNNKTSKEQNKTKEVCYNNNVENWIEFTNLSELPSKNERIGLFTDTINGENIEVIFKIKDYVVYEWASYLVTDLVSYYKLDDNAANTTVADAHSSNDMTSSTNTFNLYNDTGLLNSAFYFNGLSEYAKATISSGLSGSFTVNQWIKTTTKSKFLTSSHVNSYNNYWYISAINSNGYAYGNLYDGTNNPLVTGTTDIADGNWHMVTFVRDTGADEIRIYVDGTEEGGGATDSTTSVPTYGDFGIGEHQKSRWAAETIDEISVFSTALNVSSITDLYNSGAGLGYPFEEESSNTAPILTANATSPATIYTNTDWLINLTATDPEESYLNVWTTFFVNDSEISTEYYNLTNNTNSLVATLNSGNFSNLDNLTASIILGDGTDNNSAFNLTSTATTSIPNITNIIWSTTGGFTDDTLLFNQVLDYINATCQGSYGLIGCNITITDPDSISTVDNQAMTNTSSNFTYTSDINLNKAGTWTINITAYNSEGNSNSSSDTITVSTQNQSIKDGWYGYSNSSILTQSEISILSAYGYDLFEIEDNITTTQADFSTILTSINNSRNSNIKTGLNIILDFDYNNSGLKTQYLTDIAENFSSLNVVPYADSIVYISLELENQGSYTDTTLYTILNDFAENITSETGNEFVIYSKNYNSSNLDSSYIQYTEMLYFTSSNEQNFIEDQKQAFRNNESLNRIYTSISNTVKTSAQNFHSNIIDNLRSLPDPNNLSNINASNLNNKDVLIFNNQSTSQNFTIDVSGLSVSGKDVWDSTTGKYIENNTDQTITVEVSGYNVSIVYFEDLDHIQLDSLTESVLYKADADSVAIANHTDGNLDGNFGLSGAYDIQIELYDPHYSQANFITYYGWINVTAIDWTNYEVVILADKNNAELDALNYTPTEFYGYISVADYNNTQGWTDAKNAEVDEWLGLNDSLNIFIDGMDSGVGGTNFSSRMKEVVDYVQITKARKAILNTYTAYEDFATWGMGGVMKESCVNRWNGASASNPDNYTRENWTLELERSEWFTAHGVDVLCQAFNNRSVDGTFTIENYTELQNIYFASKVLGYDYFYLSQPDFQYIHEEYVYDVGGSLQRNAQQLSTDTNTYYRTYENGIVYYNTTSEQGWIDDGLIVNNITTCFYLYDPHAANPNFEFTINNRQPTGSAEEYSFPVNWGVGTWKWACVDTTDETPINGRYLIEAWVGDHTVLPGQGANLGWSTYTDSNKHSWYDTSTTDSYTAYPADRNWMVNMSINVTKRSSVDTSDKIIQTEANATGLRNITISANSSFPIEIWSYPTSFENFGNVSYLNSTGSFIVLNYSNNTDCDSDSPTWNSSTIEGETFKACIEESGNNTIVRVATPTLSDRIFQITNISSAVIDIIAPNITINNPEPNEDNRGSEITLIITTSEISICNYSFDSGTTNISMSSTDNLTHSKELALSSGSYSVIFFCSDPSGNSNNSSVNFSILSIPTDGGGGSPAVIIEEEFQIEEIGETNKFLSTISLTKVEILNKKLCIKEDHLRFKPEDDLGELTKLTSGELYINNTKLDKKLFLDLTNEEYYYILKDLEIGKINITVIANQNGKIIQTNKELEIKDCTTIQEFSETKLNRLLEWMKSNQTATMVIVSVVLILATLGWLGYDKK